MSPAKDVCGYQEAQYRQDSDDNFVVKTGCPDELFCFSALS
jgi:hypothetical protein